MWKARVVQWQNAGIPVTAVAPTEGTLAYVSGFVIPKNAPNKEGGYAYLDAMLAKSAQEAFAVDMATIPPSPTPWSRPISTNGSASPPTRSRNWSISTTTT